MHQVEIEWQDEVCSDPPKGAFLRVDPDVFGPSTYTMRFIDLRVFNGDYLQWCVRVVFRHYTTRKQQDKIMQTVLMMAKARYGL